MLKHQDMVLQDAAELCRESMCMLTIGQLIHMDKM